MSTPTADHTNLEALLLQVWGSEDNLGVTPSERLIGKQTAETLREWCAQPVAITAAVLMPLLARGRRHLPRAAAFSPRAIDLAQRLADRRASLVLGPGAGGTGDAWLSSNLSRMYREAYLDLPELSFTLLLLAHHDAVLLHAGELSKEDARLTQGVFAPFAEMLGLWSLYRRWVEKSYAVLFRDEFSEMEMLMGPPENYTEESFREMQAADGGADGNQLHKNFSLVDKAAAFVSLKLKLDEKFALKRVTADVEPIQNLTGLSLKRVRGKESREDVARRLGVRIICESIDECYAALGILHSLGRPVSLSSLLHFQDHIASPQPNGYRALQAAITYRGYTPSGGGSIVIECRILTQEMLMMNEYGVVAALRETSRLTAPSNAWWNQVSKLSAQLSRVLGVDDGPTLPEYLSTRNAGSVSDPLYVFTPRGEIVLLPQGSTPLDFAYRIHSEMGHHALRVDVNGQSVPHGYPLRNGDIVRVHYDPDYAGPDISWINLVATQTARTSIKRKLAARARAAHTGRAYVEAALLSALDSFQRRKSFNLSVTTDRLEGFLRERASFYGYADVTKFYSNLDGNNQLVQRLVGDLVSAELTVSLAAPGGEALPYGLDQMRICRACLPVPGDSIVGCETTAGSGKKLSVHRAGAQRCLTSVKNAVRVNLTWSDKSHIDHNELLVFSITGDDRQRLLQDVLDAVYRTEEAYLYKVEATTFGDRRAIISLVVRADTFDRFTEIETRLGNVAGVHEIATAPPSPSQRATLVADPLHRQPPRQLPPLPPNPYTSEEVYTRDIFYDRQELLDIFLEWLREPPPTKPMILHGQRRVGKTSLVMYLRNEYLPAYRLVQSVLVNFQDLSGFAPQNVAGLIVRTIFRDIRQSAPPQEEGEEPMEWLSRSLDEALKYYPRLLVIIDEFNVLIDIERESQTNSLVYNNLRAVMSAQRTVNWLLVVQDTHFFDREMWRGAGVLFQKAKKHAVEHLDRNWSRRLILEPARKCGIAPQDEKAMIDEVLRLTAGSPFLIHLICRELVDRARRQGRTIITTADLKAASDIVIHEGERWFFHFMQNLTALRELVMAAVTFALRDENDSDESQVIKLTRAKAPEITIKTVRHTLVELAKEGLISIQTKDDNRTRRISIQIGLFKIFLSDKMDIDKSLAKWRASLRIATKRRAALTEK